MSRTYYIFANGRIARKDNTICFESESGRKVIPIEDIDSIFLFGESDLNTKLLNFLSQKKIALHVFNYYGFYSGSFYPREYLQAGFVLIKQAQCYSSKKARLELAKEFERAQAHNIMRNIAYYNAESRLCNVFEKELEHIEKLACQIGGASSISELLGIEGNIREKYYSCWRTIIGDEFNFTQRVKRPPDNLVNALISFGNSMMYSTVLSEIYRSQLEPTISFLHEPGYRRFSLALDIAEIFKPIIVDRLIFNLLNTKQVKLSDTQNEEDCIFLSDSAKKKFVSAYEEKLNTTIKHRRINKQVSYRTLIRMECYKLIKHITEIEQYDAFKAWW